MFPIWPVCLERSTLVNDSDALVPVMDEYGLGSILCAGSGVSQEPRALATAGFDVTALDISSLAARTAEEFPSDPERLRHWCRPSTQRAGGSIDFVIGDLLDSAECPGPFDVIIERLTVQRFPEAQRGTVLGALSGRTEPSGDLRECLSR